MRICIPGPPSLLPPSHFETKARGIVPVPLSSFLHRTLSVHLQTTKKKGHGHAESRTRPPSRFFVPPPSNPGTGLRPRAAFLFPRPLPVRLSSQHPHKGPRARTYAYPAPLSPNTLYRPLELTRYPADSVEIQSPSPSYVSPLDAAPNCGIQCIFIRWIYVIDDDAE